MVGLWNSCWLNAANAVLSMAGVLVSVFLNIPQNYFGLYLRIFGRLREYSCLLSRHCLLNCWNACAVAGWCLPCCCRAWMYSCLAALH
jgi:hypothetical protein